MKSNHPNILFLLPDQHRFDWLGCFSGPVNTPNIDMLIRHIHHHLCVDQPVPVLHQVEVIVTVE